MESDCPKLDSRSLIMAAHSLPVGEEKGLTDHETVSRSTALTNC
jgi:hypothetical protein